MIYSTYEQLLEQMNQPSLHNRRMHDILILVYKSIHGLAPKYINISDLFSLRSPTMNSRDNDSLIIPRVNTTKYGLLSVAFRAGELWILFIDVIRASPTIQSLKVATSGLDFFNGCCSFCK